MRMLGQRRRSIMGSFPARAAIAVTRAIVAAGSYGLQALNRFGLAPGRRRSERNRRNRAGRPRTDRQRSRLGQNLRRLSLGCGRVPHGRPFPWRKWRRQSKRHTTPVVRSRPTPPPRGNAAGDSAGVDTIEHGDEGTPEVFRLMKEHQVACPTVAAQDAVQQYHGWKKGVDPEPDILRAKHASMKAARAAGVTFCDGRGRWRFCPWRECPGNGVARERV